MFRLSNGPWTKLFDGNVEGQAVELYSNSESMVLVMVFEKEKEKTVGVVMELFKAFYCTGSVEAFVETLPRDSVVFIKHSEKKTFKFFVLGSAPTYVKFDESAIQNEFDNILKKIKATAQMAKDVSKAYDLSLIDLQFAGEEEKQSFFAEPLSLQMLSRSALEGHKATEFPESGVPGELFLGVTKDGTVSKEPLEFFRKTVIDGPEEKYRMHAVHLLIEGALLSNLSTVIIDWKNSFRGLSEPTKDLQGLRKFKVDFEPIGFPVAHFTVPDAIKIDLGIVDIQSALELYGAGKGIVAKAIIQKTSQKRYNSIPELVKEIKKTAPSEEANAYQLNKAVRILSLFELHYPKFAGGKNNFDELAKSWSKGLGRAGIIHLENTDEKSGLLIVHSLVRGLTEHFKKQGPTNRLRAMIIIPEAQKILPSNPHNKVSELLSQELSKLSDYGVGFALSIEKSSDLNNELFQKTEAEIGIIEKNDSGVKIKDRKNYRVLLRPGLSSCTET